MKTTLQFDLDTIPLGARTSGVTVESLSIAGRPATQVRLTDRLEADGEPGVDYVDQPTFLVLPVTLTTGSLTVDILSRMRPDAPEMARGFAGLAFHILPDNATFECVYLRPLNGAEENPPVERRGRAVQYFAYPDYPYDRLRVERPAEFEAAAQIGLNRWIHLALEITDTRITAEVDGRTVLSVPPLVSAVAGQIGLFVDIGSQAAFSSLQVTPAS
jgi:hypothetical protein